ncbi:PH domain-containing protein [Flavobacterium sp. RHBU_3]|uniref:PH domain-containing protein n=1 Tax=Flavobacterium sp. RHBU_3 TaxID=3391184 RepID=UPI00398494B8
MPKVFRSKIGPELIILLSVGMLPALVTMLAEEEKDWVAILIMPALFVLVLLLLRTTRYTINGSTLRAYVWFFGYKPIDINTITTIKDTSNPLSAPAASLDRMEIRHARGYLLVSPKDKEGFIQLLQEINPAITYNSKN